MPIMVFVFIKNKLIKTVILPNVGAVIRTIHPTLNALQGISS